MKTILKYFLRSWLLTFVLVGGLIAWKSRDIAATHPSLVEAALPALIPTRQFYADQAGEWRYKPSYDGTYIAWRGTRMTQQVVLVGQPGKGGGTQELFQLKDVQNFYWHDLKNRLMIFSEDRLWEVDPTDPDKENWQDVTPRGFQGWRFGSRPSEEQPRQVITSRDRDPALTDLYTTAADGSDKQLLIRNEGETLSWDLRQDLTPGLRFDRGEPGYIDFWVNDTQGETAPAWRKLNSISVNETFHILEVTTDNKHAFAVSSLGRDKSAIVKVDLLTGQESILAQEADEDLLDVINLDPFDNQIDLVISKHNQNAYFPFSPRGEAMAKLLQNIAERVDVDGLHWAGKGRFVTVSVAPDALNYEYLLLDLDEVSATQLGTFSFRQNHLDKLVTTQEVTIPARDGLSVPAVLLLPKGTNAPVPTVIEVHGGPALHVSWEYHHFRQFLVNRGYAVLSVNFRGSTGFGKTFQQAGFEQFGRAMQDDLVDAVNWAVSKGIADADNIAILGGSYGGYAAAMGMVRDGDVFKAGIVEHAVLDLAYQMQNNPFAWGLTPEYTQRYFGNPDTPEDLQRMRDRSPQSHVANLKGPILLVAGKRDRIVGFEQSEAFEKAALALGKDVDLLVFEHEGHGLQKWQSNIEHARRVEDFLATHLGGRSGGWDWIELATQFID